MLAIGCILISLVICGTQGQNNHGHNSQSICHSNHQQLSEDQVIHNVVTSMDDDMNGVIELWEMNVFFAELLDRSSPEFVAWLKNMTEDQLINVTETYLSNYTTSINKHEFTHAWHTKFHDSMAFVESVFDIFIDHNDNGLIDGDEVLKLRNDALRDYDANGDGMIENAEMEAFFESIYKRSDCVTVIG